MKFTNEQIRVLKSKDRQILLSGGPGTGKTFTLACLAAKNADALTQGQVAVLSLTNQSVEKLWEILQEMNQKPGLLSQLGVETVNDNRIYCRSLHGFCFQVLRNFGEQLSLNLINEKEFLDKILAGTEWANDPGVVHQLLKTYRAGSKPNKQKHTRIPSDTISDILIQMDALKHKKGVMTFNDLLKRFYARLGDKIFRQYVRGMYPVIILDEFQDISDMAWKILKRLVSNKIKLIVSGDERQTAFAWADASFNRFSHFRKKYPNAEYTLTKNFRSTIQIQSLLDSLLSQKCKKTIALKNGPKPFLAVCGGVRETSEYVIQEIKKLVDKGMTYDRIAIVYRFNRDYLIDLHGELMRAEIPFRVVGDKSIRERPYARIFFALAEIIEKEKPNKEAWKTVLHMLKGVGPAAEEKIIAWIKEKGKHDTMYPKKLGFTEPLEDLLIFVNQLKKSNLEIPDKVIMMVEFMKKMPKVRRPARKYVLPTLFKLAEESSLMEMRKKFMNKSEPLYYPTGKPPYPDEYLTLFNVHQTKGQAYETVFYLCTTNELYENFRLFETPMRNKQERHLLRLAVSRAKSNLVIALPIDRKTLYRGGDVTNPWRFLRACPKKTFRIVEP